MTQAVNKITKRLKRITYFEWFVLLIVAFIAIGVVRFFREKSEWRTIRVQVVGKDWTNTFGQKPIRPPFWLADKVKVGDVEKNASGNKIAEVLKVEKYENENSTYPFTNMYLTIIIKAKNNKTIDKYTYKGKVVAVGEPIEFLLARTSVVGQIIDDQVPVEGYEFKEVIITGRLRGREPWYINQVNPGDVMIDQGSGEVIAEIISTSIEPSTTDTLASQGDGVLTIEKSPTKRDLVFSAKIKVTNFDDRWYFTSDQKVKIGEFIHIFLPEVDLEWVWILSVQDLD